MKVKEESEKAGLKLNIQKTKIMASSPMISWQTDGETATDFISLGSKINKVCHCFDCLPIFCHEVMGLDSVIVVF